MRERCVPGSRHTLEISLILTDSSNRMSEKHFLFPSRASSSSQHNSPEVDDRPTDGSRDDTSRAIEQTAVERGCEVIVRCIHHLYYHYEFLLCSLHLCAGIEAHNNGTLLT